MLKPRETFLLGRAEWAVVGVIAAAIVVVNKLVVHDQGSSWPTLVWLAIMTGVGSVHLRRWWRDRRGSRSSMS